MKIFIAAFCIFQVAFAISSTNLATLSGALARARFDNARLRTYSSSIIARNGADNALVANAANQLITDLGNIINELNGLALPDQQVLPLVQDILDQAKIMVACLEKVGVPQETLYGYAYPNMLGNMLNVLETYANSLNSSIPIGTIFGFNSNGIVATKPDAATVAAFNAARQKVIENNAQLQAIGYIIVNDVSAYENTILSNYQIFMDKIGNAVYAYLAPLSTTSAATAKSVVSSLTTQTLTAVNVLAAEGIPKGNVISTVAFRMFGSALAALDLFTTLTANL